MRTNIMRALVLLALIITLALVAAVVDALPGRDAGLPEAVELRGVFVDLDGDGRLDYLVSGQVVLNRPNAAGQVGP